MQIRPTKDVRTSFAQHSGWVGGLGSAGSGAKPDSAKSSKRQNKENNAVFEDSTHSRLFDAHAMNGEQPAALVVSGLA